MVKVKPVAMDGVEGIVNGTTMAGLQQTGSIRRGDGFGFIRFGHSALGASVFAGGVYQKRVTGYNHKGRNPNRVRRSYYVRMRYYRPTNPNTPAQQAGRSKFALAMAGWQGLSASEKKQFNTKANKLRMRGVNLYISEFMKYN